MDYDKVEIVCLGMVVCVSVWNAGPRPECEFRHKISLESKGRKKKLSSTRSAGELQSGTNKSKYQMV